MITSIGERQWQNCQPLPEQSKYVKHPWSNDDGWFQCLIHHNLLHLPNHWCHHLLHHQKSCMRHLPQSAEEKKEKKNNLILTKNIFFTGYNKWYHKQSYRTSWRFQPQNHFSCSTNSLRDWESTRAEKIK